MALLLQIFWLFTRVALFSWGGGPASLGLMQREVLAVNWVTPDEFADGVAFSNALPGPVAPQVAAFVGYKLAGVPGAISATIGTVVPATVLMLIMVALFFGIKDSPVIKSMLTAVRPVVVGLLLWTAYDLGRTVFGAKQLGWAGLLQSWDKVIIALVAFAILTFTTISPVFLIIAAAVFGLLVYR
jgi:chromate transporter